MNWGKGIAIFLVTFIVFITTLAVILMRASADLESEDYYLKEIKFGDEIEAQQNAKNSNISLVDFFDNDGLILKIEGTDSIDLAELKLTRPDNPSKDITKTFKGDMVYVSLAELEKGLYKVVIDWENEHSYQLRKEIWIK